jgi:hypothetical protein
VASKGLCGICGKGGKLSDEHIPPECAGNFRGISLHTLGDRLAADRDPEQMKNGQPRPKGTLWSTICERCNNEVLGSWYPTLAYIMTFDEREPDTRPFLPCGGLHNFARVAYDVLASVELDMLIGSRDSPLPG